MAEKRTLIPARYLSIASQGKGKTVAARGPGGRFKGRRGPNSEPTRSNPYLKPYNGPGDTTKERHIIQSRDFNRNGRIDPYERGGTVRGRTKKERVRMSSRAKGYSRRV